MKALALSKKPRTFVPDIGMDNPPRFTVTSLSKRQLLQIQVDASVQFPVGAIKNDNTVDIAKALDSVNVYEIMLNNLDSTIAVVRKGLSGWVNLYNEDGELFEFSPENIEYLHPDLLNLLALEIRGKLTDIQAKNSDSLSSLVTGSETNPEPVVGEESGTATPVKPETSEIAGA